MNAKDVCIGQLQDTEGKVIGGMVGGPAIDHKPVICEGGPFSSEAEWNEWIPGAITEPMYQPTRRMVGNQLRTDHRIVLTDGDLHGTNILVRDGRIVALPDWEHAGFYYKYVEFLGPGPSLVQWLLRSPAGYLPSSLRRRVYRRTNQGSLLLARYLGFFAEAS